MTGSVGQVVFAGIDGGGTGCRVRLRDGSGRLLAQVEGAAANVYLDFEGAGRNIRDALGRALVAAAIAPGGALRLGLGLAGVSNAAVGTTVARHLADLGAVTVTHDADIACLGAHGGEDGGLVIAGTGSAAVAHVGGTSTLIGGRGFFLGDDGSGARLGLEALRRALRAHDGLEPATDLTRHLMSLFGHDPVALIEWGRGARSRDFGVHAPVVFEYCTSGDPVAQSLVAAAAGAIDDMARALALLGAARIALVGGLARPIEPHLSPATRALLREPLFDALEGALLLAGSPLPAERAAAAATNPDG